MAEFDSLSFALLIPFAICFALVFIVCCFADEIKDICRMPSPLPRSYLAPEHVNPRRHNNRRPLRQNWQQNEEVRNLILSEEGRSRNESESSTDYVSANNVLANSFSNVNSSRQTGVNLQQTVMLLPQSIVPSVGQRSGIPNTNCVILQPVVSTIITPSCRQMQPLSQFAVHSSNRNTNYSRNLTVHASASSKDLHSSLNMLKVQQCQTGIQLNKDNTNSSLNRNESAPHLLNSYLSNGSSSTNSSPLSQVVVKKENDTIQTEKFS